MQQVNELGCDFRKKKSCQHSERKKVIPRRPDAILTKLNERGRMTSVLFRLRSSVTISMPETGKPESGTTA